MLWILRDKKIQSFFFVPQPDIKEMIFRISASHLFHMSNCSRGWIQAVNMASKMIDQAQIESNIFAAAYAVTNRIRPKQVGGHDPAAISAADFLQVIPAENLCTR